MGAVYSPQRIGGAAVFGALFADGGAALQPAPLASGSVLAGAVILYTAPGAALPVVREPIAITLSRPRRRIGLTLSEP